MTGASKFQAVLQATVFLVEQTTVTVFVQGRFTQHCMSETLSMCAPAGTVPDVPVNRMVNVVETGTNSMQYCCRELVFV